MSKKTILVFLISFSFFQNSLIINADFGKSNLKDNKEIVSSKANLSKNTISGKKYNKSKKDIKKEIKRRKKYHRSLLSLYNKSFDKRYFELIKDNSMKIIELRKENKSGRD